MSEIARRADAQAKEISARIALEGASIIDGEGKSQKSSASKRSRKSMRSVLLEGKVREQNKKCLSINEDTLGQSNENHGLIPGAVAGIPIVIPTRNSVESEQERVADLADPVLRDEKLVRKPERTTL